MTGLFLIRSQHADTAAGNNAVVFFRQCLIGDDGDQIFKITESQQRFGIN